MKRKNYFKGLFFVFVLILFYGYGASTENKVQVNSISVNPGALNAKIKIEATSPLTASNSYYMQGKPFKMVLILENVKTSPKPKITMQKSTLITGIDVASVESDKLQLKIDLKEQVPYRFIHEGNTLWVEFHKVLTALGKVQPDQKTESDIAAQGKNNLQLNDINISNQVDRVNIRAKLNGKPIPHVFALSNPSRLVIDLYNTVNSRNNINQKVGQFGVQRIRSAQFKTGNPHAISRIVVDLEKPQLYSMTSSLNELILTFFDKTNKVSAPIVTEAPPTVEEESSSPKKQPDSLPEISLPVEEIKPVISAEETKSSDVGILPDETIVENKINLSEIAEEKGNASVETESEYQDQFLPRTLTEEEDVKYTGDLISPKFKDADLRDVILYLGEEAGLNVVFDPDVRGTVTCNFDDIPWDQFIDIVLKTNKMGKSLEGNVLRIAPMTVLTREQEDARKLEDSMELAGPVLSRTFKLSYSKASDVKALLESKISERGEIIIDNRTNTLIVSEVSDRIGLLEELITVLDTPTPQVSIEARIVEASSTFIRNLGIQWGWRGIADPFYGNQTSLQFPNKLFSDGAMIPQGISTKGIGGPLGGYAINLPAPAFSTAIGLSLSNVLNTLSVDMALSALETSGSGRIISAPSVVTQNNQEAEIIQGRQIPVQTIANFTVTTRYVNAALELRATPQITAEGTIIMTIDIQNNAADFANLVNGIPPITRQSAHTVVMIPDGGTTVIGGIYRTEDSITHERVPFLHKIPILGNLFRSFARTKQNRELLIFITPRILK